MDITNKYLSIKNAQNNTNNYKVTEDNKLKELTAKEKVLNYDFKGDILQVLDDNKVLYTFKQNKSHSEDYNNEYVFFEGVDSDDKPCSLMLVDLLPRLWESTTRYKCYWLIKIGILQSIGEHTYGNIQLEDFGHYTKLEIGDYCSFAEGLTIIMSNHSSQNISTFPFDVAWHVYGENDVTIINHSAKNNELKIGNDVWIGRDVKILPSVSSIGDGAIIAAGAVVTKNVEPYSIVGGVPAKHIRYRFKKDQIEELLKIKWWEWDEKTIKERVKDITSPNIDDFIKKYKKH